jgi:long-chain acyl-CoA synthetase
MQGRGDEGMLSDSTLGEFFRAAIDIPEIPFGEMLWESAQRFPEKIAIVFQGQKISYRELDGLANSFANALARLGVKKGDRVALYMTNRPEYVISVYGIARLGAVFTPMNPAYKEGEIEYQLNDAEASVLVVQESLYPLVRNVRAQLGHLREVILVGQRAEAGTSLFRDLIRQSSPKHPPQVTLHWTEDLVALPYSSGTTGLPKGVMLTQQNLVANNIQFIASGRISDHDTLLIFLPFYHIYGLMLVGGGLYAGATLVIMEAFDLERSLMLAQQHQVTLYYAVPPILVALDNSSRAAQYPLPHLRYIMVGAAPLAPDVAQRVQEKLHVTVLQGYGLTEASPVTHLNPVDQGRIKLDSVGLAVPNQEQRIVDLETGERDLEVGDIGELFVKGPHIMKGYWKAPEETAQAVRDGWLATGDIARMDRDGYVYIVDRKKEMIKYNGFSVAPSEVEAVLFQHPAVADCAVIGKPDPAAGEIPKALVMLRPGEDVTPEALMEFVEGRVAGYKKIREVEFVLSIPKTASGKVLRRVLIEAERQKVAIEPVLEEEPPTPFDDEPAMALEDEVPTALEDETPAPFDDEPPSALDDEPPQTVKDREPVD